MGILLDTTVFIHLERATRRRPVAHAMRQVAGSLAEQLGEDDDAGIASITASELLHGVHRASEEHRQRREAFVEGVLTAFPTLAFDLLVARIHARLWANLTTAGKNIGAHDRLIAATALSAGWRVASANIRHFEGIEGLELVPISFN